MGKRVSCALNGDPVGFLCASVSLGRLKPEIIGVIVSMLLVDGLFDPAVEKD